VFDDSRLFTIPKTKVLEAMTAGVDFSSRVMFAVSDKLGEAAWTDTYDREVVEPLLLLQASGRRAGPEDRRLAAAQEKGDVDALFGDEEPWGVELECGEADHDGNVDEDELASPDVDRTQPECNDETEAIPKQNSVRLRVNMCFVFLFHHVSLRVCRVKPFLVTSLLIRTHAVPRGPGCSLARCSSSASHARIVVCHTLKKKKWTSVPT
jgi:hypothetical protein